MTRRVALGLDFGTESVRALLVDCATGELAGTAVSPYRHGVMDEVLEPAGVRLPADFALQQPADYLDSLAEAVHRALQDSAVDPASVVGIDPAMGYVQQAESRVDDPRASFVVADAMELPFADKTYDVVVSGLVLNFVPDPAGAITEQARVARPGGVVGAYVWDYRDGLEFQRVFWEAAFAVEPSAVEAARRSTFPIAGPDRLEVLFAGAGLQEVRVRPIEIQTTFASFDELWADFLGASRLSQGDEPGWKGPSYDLLGSVDDAAREAIEAEYRARLTIAPSGHIASTARAWAVSGRRVELA